MSITPAVQTRELPAKHVPTDAASITLFQEADRALLALAIWTMIAIMLGLNRLTIARHRPRVVHGRTVLGGSLAGVVGLILTAGIGWLVTAAVAALLIVWWAVRTGDPHA